MAIWLTRIVVDTRHRSARADLADITGLHRRVMRLFPATGGPRPRHELGVLHRLDITNAGAILLVQSAVSPDTRELPEGYGHAQTTGLDRLLDSLRPGQILRYRVLLNATRRPKSGEMAGKRVALGAEDTGRWWERHARGLRLVAPATLTAQTLTGRDPNGNRVVLRPWRVDGVAEVTAPDSLRMLVAHGVGKGRAFGCGLVSIAPVR